MYVQTLILIYLGWYMPMDSELSNYLHLFTEILILLQTYPLLLFTDYVVSPKT